MSTGRAIACGFALLACLLLILYARPYASSTWDSLRTSWSSAVDSSKDALDEFHSSLSSALNSSKVVLDDIRTSVADAVKPSKNAGDDNVRVALLSALNASTISIPISTVESTPSPTSKSTATPIVTATAATTNELAAFPSTSQTEGSTFLVSDFITSPTYNPTASSTTAADNETTHQLRPGSVAILIMLSVLMIGIFVAYSVLYVYQSFYWRKSTSYPNDNAHAESAAVRLLAPPKQEKVCAAAPSRSADVEGGHSDGHTISQAGEAQHGRVYDHDDQVASTSASISNHNVHYSSAPTTRSETPANSAPADAAMPLLDDSVRVDRVANVDVEPERGPPPYEILEGSTGHTYAKIFGPYINASLTSLTVEDPYLHERYQFEQLKEFLKAFTARARNLRHVKVVTKKATGDNEAEQRTRRDLQVLGLTRLSSWLTSKSVKFTWEYDAELHDRWFRLDNGWSVQIGRGLSFYHPSSGASDRDFAKRRCRKTTATFHAT